MAEYIKREDALKWIVIHGGDSCTEYNDCEYRDTDKACSDCLYSDINKIPAADVLENVHGKWVDDGFLSRKTCSICGTWIANNTGTAKLNYCPNCGADLRNSNTRSIGND